VRITKVISTLIEKSILIVKVLRLGNADVQTGYNIQPFGIDSNIPAGYKAIFAETGNRGEKIILGIINTKALAQPGELRLHSEKADGTESFPIYLKNNGTCEIGGNTDFMVRFSKLEEGFNTLKTDHNNLVSAFNAHMHATAAVGSPSPPTAIPSSIPAQASTASIAAAKINEIKTF